MGGDGTICIGRVTRPLSVRSVVTVSVGLRRRIGWTLVGLTEPEGIGDDFHTRVVMRARRGSDPPFRMNRTRWLPNVTR